MIIYSFVIRYNQTIIFEVNYLCDGDNQYTIVYSIYVVNYVLFYEFTTNLMNINGRNFRTTYTGPPNLNMNHARSD